MGCKIHLLLSIHTTLITLPSKAEGWWFLNCLYGRRDSNHLGDGKCIPSNKIKQLHTSRNIRQVLDQTTELELLSVASQCSFLLYAFIGTSTRVTFREQCSFSHNCVRILFYSLSVYHFTPLTQCTMEYLVFAAQVF